MALPKIGDIVTIDYKPPPLIGLLRSHSLYGYSRIVFAPTDPNIQYTVCSGTPERGFFLVQTGNPALPIGFSLLYQNNTPYVCVTQTSCMPELATAVTIVGHDPNPPPGYKIGTL
jgi:hypothetical protein